MRAAVMRDFGGPDVLTVDDVDRPIAGPGELRIAVAAVAVQRARDVETRAGRHPFARLIRLPHVLGGEHAGVVESVGAGVSTALVGRRVAVSAAVPCSACVPCRCARDDACQGLELLGVHRPGAYAELAVVPVANAHPIPARMSFAAAAMLAATGPIACAQLDAGAVGWGSWVAVTGASGMLGSMLVALAAARGARVVALTRGGRHQEPLRRLGATAVLDIEHAQLEPRLAELTAGHGVDVVIDNLATAATWERCGAALAPLGRVVISGVVGPGDVALDPRRLYLRGQSVVGVRTASRAQVAAFWHAVHGGAPMPDRPLRSYPLDRVAEAHAALEQARPHEHPVLEVACVTA